MLYFKISAEPFKASRFQVDGGEEKGHQNTDVVMCFRSSRPGRRRKTEHRAIILVGAGPLDLELF